MTRQDANKIIILLTAAYPNFQPDVMAASLWQRKLSDLDYHAVERAVDAYIDTPARFAPSIGELKQRVISQHSDTNVFDLWLRLKKHMSYYGADRKDEALETIPAHVKDAIELIGWKRLCRMPEAEAGKQFLSVMTRVLQHPETLTALSQQAAPQISGGVTWE